MIKKIRKKYFTTSGYSKFTSNTLDAKIIQKNLVNESDWDRKIKEERKKLAKKAELKAEQEKIVKFQTYYSSLFIGQSNFDNDGLQNYYFKKYYYFTKLVFQPIQKTITTFSGLPDTVSELGSKGLSN